MNQTDRKEPSPSMGEGHYYMEEDDGISLKDLTLTLWGYRRIIVILSFGATLLITVIAGLIYLGQTREGVAKLQFKLDFQGVDKGQYPNGMRFSTSDIISVPVMDRVYEENGLEQYMEFPDFKAALAIIQTNDYLEFLEYEYAAKLSDKQLSVDARRRIETEFLEKKKSALIPVYTLMWDLGSGEAIEPISADQVAKTLNDILRAWAEYAHRVKGATQYQISLVSRNILSKKDIDEQDYYIAMDMLRLGIKRIIADIRKLEGVPGAKTLKIGKDRVSLSDLNYRMADAESFKLNPLVGLIRQSGVTRDRDIAIGYLKNRIFELTQKYESAVESINVYEKSLNEYAQKPVTIVPSAAGDTTPRTSPQGTPLLDNVPAMIPQLGASFLNSLIQMAQESSDARFRQEITEKVIDVGLEKVGIEGDLNYYNRLLKQITDPQNGEISPSFVKNATARIKTNMESVFNILIRTIDEINTMYVELSKVNLNPASMLYTVTEPVIVDVERPVKPRKFLMYMILAWILAEGMIILGVLAANAFAGPGSSNREKS
ncbi:MAG: hypothetical protein JRJ71_05575 [Deltaproteobacteria bacterium]|nr:hypothetical protein [Deltaproteobacteria bacterium]